MQPQPKHLHCDVLVIGGGLAGCWAALRARNEGASVILVDKGYISRAGCSPVCGGVTTAPLPTDDLDAWAEEFVTHAHYTNNQEWLDQLLSDLVERIQELDRMGAPIVKDEKGQIRRLKSRGMHNVTCLQFNPMATMHMMRDEVERRGATILDRMHIMDLIKSTDGRVAGAVGVGTRTGETFLFHAGATVVSSGPLSVKGRGVVDTVGADGHSLAYRAGAKMVDMEFAFGGTFSVMLKKYKFPAYNVALGHGSRLINARGERFMEKHDPRRLERSELPHVIAAFLNELQHGRGPCYIDLTHCDEHFVDDMVAVKGHAWADEFLTGRITDYKTRPVLIEPQWTVWSHRCGIQIDMDCRTSMPGLLSAGSVVKIEAVGTHASAGIPTAFCSVSGTRAGTAAAAMAKGQARASLDKDQVETSLARVSAIGARNSGVTTNEVFTGIRKVLGTPLDTLALSEERIDNIRARLAKLHKQCDELMIPDPHEFLKSEEARNFIEVFDLCMLAARNRTESRESFYRSDYPYTDNVEWMGWHAVRIEDGKPVFSRERLPVERYRRQPTEKLPDRELSPLARILEHPEAKKAEAVHG